MCWDLPAHQRSFDVDRRIERDPCLDVDVGLLESVVE